MTTTVIQFRAPLDMVRQLDVRASEAGAKRADIARRIIEQALEGDEAHVPTVAATLDISAIEDRLGEVIAHVEAGREAAQAATDMARLAYAAARLAALFLLPDPARQEDYVRKLDQVRQA